jgi:hypothetical protein
VDAGVAAVALAGLALCAGGSGPVGLTWAGGATGRDRLNAKVFARTDAYWLLCDVGCAVVVARSLRRRCANTRVRAWWRPAARS